MTFHSILFERTEEDSIKKETLEAPDFFVDLNLDQIIDAITAGKQEYNLKPFFYTSLNDIDAIKYRHEIMLDLENKILFENIKSFAQRMRAMREHLAQKDKLYYKYQKESWFLDAVEIYCDAVNCLVHDLTLVDLKSRGFLAFREYLTNYTNSDRFTSLLAETKKLKDDLSTVKYCLLIKGNRINVSKYESEIDYSVEVEKTFEKFKQGAVKDYRVKFLDLPDMNHVEAGVLDLVAKLYPDIFLNLDNYCTKNSNYLDETIAVFDREIQFYIAYLEYVAIFKRAGLKFCYPQISDKCKEVYNYEGFDLALAYKLINENSTVVCNDFYLKGKERIFVVTGPNQGGKTTFARTFGQLHYLASLGCPVPGSQAQLFLYDRLFTHFEREENIKDLRGKLEDELIRIHHILNQATSNSIIIINEIFTSTTLKDAIFLSKKIMEKIIQMDLLCVWVTFIYELASMSEKTVSMVSTVVPKNPALRTYKILRKPPDGLSYALSIAEKYRLTYDCLKERIKS
ncbi:MAG: mismatch repair protein MutS [Thermoanaerobacteraceae bacterium]|jgi:DNA mismatch repair ATPase MutS|uniref:DNA mismatch repair protein MutS n=1 Tax=Biomaibacter acetigenes TaxID=2316383 RepID=A0A3G2R2L0_9FIRM|nr:DNA mismatch repair protein MutS [Biomaibacter acetigenes]AYO29612.1 DNA mismatch repair protein MutS [Biomaibacter acetigenes]MDK2879165.1 mismatch repair protein MutS [Thermoanaerobacteraceae bacterium]